MCNTQILYIIHSIYIYIYIQYIYYQLKVLNSKIFNIFLKKSLLLTKPAFIQKYSNKKYIVKYFYYLK